MGDRTGISWTEATWNPVTGCTKVSPGCNNCYAETIATRFAGGPAYPKGFDITLREHKLDQPLRWTRPRMVFVNSMSDLFHQDIPDTFIASVFAVMALSERHTFQLLTKRHGRMRSLLTSRDVTGFGHTFENMVRNSAANLRGHHRRADWPDPDAITWPLPNVWLGVSTENQKYADLRIPALLETPAAVRFISAEPLIGPIDLHAHDDGLHHWLPDYGDLYDPSDEPICQAHGIPECNQGCAFLDWIIVGGESGNNARPMHADWARAIRDQATSAGVAFHFKQWSGRHPKSLGRELDGRTWDEMPYIATAVRSHL